MSSSLTKAGYSSPCHVLRRIGLLLLACAGLGVIVATGCHGGFRAASTEKRTDVYPPEPQVPRVLALGNLHGDPPPSRTETELSQFLFGTDPPSPLTMISPTGLAADGVSVLVCDTALNTVLRWDPVSGTLAEACEQSPFDYPFALDIGPSGDRFVCDRGGVTRCDASGNIQCSFKMENGDFKPTGVLVVDDTVLISNRAAQRIEVFDAASGQHLRSIGEPGHGPGQFNMPRGLARDSAGNVYVVDVLNNRVQVFDRDYKWLRFIGQPGDNVGSFGRPRDVAVGPDDTVFVSDAFSQRVHAFAPDGWPLLAFGEPETGIGELTLPNGVAVLASAPQADRAVPETIKPEYYVLVAEQLNHPGVRVYAWLGAQPGEPVAFEIGGRSGRQRQTDVDTDNPHWAVDGCTSCHQRVDGKLAPIPIAQVDALCVSCHDGVQAAADPHPIGRPAQTELVNTPKDWPTVDGAIGCLTCHDLSPQCTADGQRPPSSYLMLRGYDAQRPLAYCSTCHRPEVGERFSPHRQRDAAGRIRDDACLFCHTQRPEVPADGRRRFQPHLRVESSELCLNCHNKHWDLSPLGHVDRPVTPRIRQWMLMRELSTHSGDSPRELARLAAQSDRAPARLPLGQDRVTCYTCHNPHYTGLFTADSELGALADNANDRSSALRTDWIDLCSECHSR